MTRKNIATFLDLKHSSNVEVADNKVVCDGFTDQDLCAITPELLKGALDEKTLVEKGISTTDVYDMFYELVRRLEMPVNAIDKKVEDTPIIAKKPGRPRKIK
jgi:hypothetical protein